jgi:hypothetical protein
MQLTMKFTSTEIHTERMQITPRIAETMLAANDRNRPVRAWAVELLAKAQKRGEWKLHHQGVAFDWNGRLRDGQHRLMACVMSGVTIEMLVTKGVDPAAFDAVDQGIGRTLADLMSLDKRISEPLRLAATIAYGDRRVTPEQVRTISAGGVQVAIEAIVEHCGSVRKFFSSAPMKLAAAVALMKGDDSDYVLGQYRALCTLDFDSMTTASKGLVRQVNSHVASAVEKREALARATRVFDASRKGVTKIQVSDSDVTAAVTAVREILLNSVKPPFARGKLARSLVERQQQAADFR